MEPDFTNIYLATIKTWKATEGKTQTQFESVRVLGQDISAATQSVLEYISCLINNGGLSAADIISISLEDHVFLGQRIDEEEEEIIPENGILQDGFRGMPCQIHND